MSKRYTAGVVSSTSPTVNAAGASGVFTLNQQSAAQSTNNWPPYKVEKSLRCRSSASAYLSRTPSVAGNRKTWTWSGWIKRGYIGSNEVTFFAAGTSGTNFTAFAWNADKLFFQNYTSNVQTLTQTTAVYRDPSAWYHIVLAIDTTQATSANRAKVYVNGVQETNFSGSAFSQNQEFWINFTYGHTISARQLSSVDSFTDQYVAEINFIDGQALTPSSFGATDKDGNWSPIAYTGSYGTNGFYLNFKDVTSAATTGYDYSGNGNNWTLSGFNVSTANTSYDSMIDVPEDQSDGTANNRGNYCTLNPLNLPKGGTLSNGNLLWTAPTAEAQAVGTMYVSSGKWYFEVTPTTTSCGIGIASDTTNINSINLEAGAYVYYGSNGNKYNGSSGSAYGATYTNGDIIGVALDLDAGTLVFYKNNTSQGTAFTGLSGTFTALIYDGTSASAPTFTANFGQRPFTYAPPSGFKALNTFNLPEPTIKQPNQYFDALLYTGNGSSSQRTDISWTNMQPDMVWIKNRTTANNHVVHDVIRGPAFALQTNLTNATDGPVGFGSDGFGSDTGVANQLRVYTNDGRYNLNNNSYVAWGWKGTSSNTTNTSGSITSIVRANQTAGFSIVTWSGNATIGATVGHGLGVAPSMIIVKQRNGIESWPVYHISTGATKYTDLNGTAATATSITRWNNTTPSSSVITLYNDAATNGSGSNYVAYCFAPIAGYSAFGSYTGNGSSDGPFVYLGFKPKFILIRRSDIIAGWKIYNTSNLNYNPINTSLEPHDPGAEATSTNFNMDLVSNGFKLKTTYADFNTSGGNYIYAAFAETPFKYARSR